MAVECQARNVRGSTLGRADETGNFVSELGLQLTASIPGYARVIAGICCSDRTLFLSYSITSLIAVEQSGFRSSRGLGNNFAGSGYPCRQDCP